MYVSLLENVVATAEEARLASSYRNSDKRKKRNVVVLVVVVVVVSPVILFFVLSRTPYNLRRVAIYSSFVKIYFRS